MQFSSVLSSLVLAGGLIGPNVVQGNGVERWLQTGSGGGVDTCEDQASCMTITKTTNPTGGVCMGVCEVEVCMTLSDLGTCIKDPGQTPGPVSYICYPNGYEQCDVTNFGNYNDAGAPLVNSGTTVCRYVTAGNPAYFVVKDGSQCIVDTMNFAIGTDGAVTPDAGGDVMCTTNSGAPPGFDNCAGNDKQCIWKVPTDRDECNGGTTSTMPTGAMGDPHFLTWNGEWYDYMGACDLVLLDAPTYQDNLGFAAHIRTKDRLDYSYIEAAAVRIGGDILEVGSYGEYFFNGVEDADMPNTMAGGRYPVTYFMKNKHEHLFNITLGDGAYVHLKAYKDLVSIRFIGVSAHDFADSYGMMGHWKTGEHVARDGKTVIEDNDEFGQEWQVRPDVDGQLFESPRADDKCVMPSPAIKHGRRLGEAISAEAAQMACKHLKGPAMEACVYDVIATGDLGIAQAGAY